MSAVGLIAFLIILIVGGAFLMLSPESVPRNIAEFGMPVFGAGLIGLIIFAILKFFHII